jgi:hypothetical protein
MVRRHLALSIALASILSLVVGGLAYAALTPDGKVTTCVTSEGFVRSASAGNKCPKGTSPVLVDKSEASAAGPQVVQVVGDGTSGGDNLATTSTSFVDVSPQLEATLTVEQGDWVQMQFQANTDRSGSNHIFHYFTFNIDGSDVDTGTGDNANRGGIVAHYNVDRPDAANFGTGRINMTYWWKASEAGEVVIRPRHKSDGAGSGTVYVVNNGDINPIFSAANFGH